MKTAEEILTDTMFESCFTYVSFPAFAENESSVDVFDIVLSAMEEYASQYKAIIAKQEELIKTLSDDSNKDLGDYEYYLWDKYVRELESELAKLKEGETLKEDNHD
jgi:hypothetical protein